MQALILMLALLFPENANPDRLSVYLPIDKYEQEQFKKLSKYEKLTELQGDLNTLNETFERGLIENLVVVWKKNIILDKATEIEPSIRHDEKVLEQETKGFIARVGGFITFRNILLVSAGIFFAISILWLCRVYLATILLAIPIWVYETLCYVISIWAIIAGTQVSSSYLLVPVLPGCLGLMFSLIFSYDRRADKIEIEEEWPLTIISSILCLVWGTIAIYYGNSVIGFMSVAAFLSSVGFMAGVIPGIIFVGFDESKIVIQGTFAAFVLLAIHIGLTLTNTTIEQLEPFRTGAEFLGTFGYFLGLIILANKYYWRQGRNFNYGMYFLMQPISIISGIAALYLGSVMGMTMFLGVGGTWFYIYLIEKYFDIPWKDKGWAWSMLGLSIILYAMYAFSIKFPEYFLW